MFENVNELVFLSREEKINKQKDGTYTLITLGDPLMLENYTFFADNSLDTKLLTRGDKIKAGLKLVKRGFNISPQLESISLVEA